MKVKLTKFKKNNFKLIDEIYTFVGIARIDYKRKCLEIVRKDGASYGLLPHILLNNFWDKIEII